MGEALTSQSKSDMVIRNCEASSTLGTADPKCVCLILLGSLLPCTPFFPEESIPSLRHQRRQSVSSFALVSGSLAVPVYWVSTHSRHQQPRPGSGPNE